MKKNVLFLLTLAALLLAGSISAYAGGRQDPMGLAKQTYEVGVEALRAALNPRKADGVQKKAAALGEKVAALTPDNRAIFDEELERLTGEGMGGLLAAAGDMDSSSDTGFILVNAFSPAVSAIGGGYDGGSVQAALNADGQRSGSRLDSDEEDGTSNAPSQPTGLVGRLLTAAQSLFGGGTSRNTGRSGASGGNAAIEDKDGESKSAASNSTASGGSTSIASGGSSGLSKRLESAFGVVESGNYHMKAKTNFEGMEVIADTYVKGGMIASVSEVMGMTVRSIHRDNMVHVIYDEMKTIMSFTPTSDNTPQEPVKTSGLVMTGSGNARFDGRNLPYEEYSLESDRNIKTQFFFNGNNLAGMRTISGEMTIDMVILEMNQNVPNSVFEIPAGYQRMQM